MRMDVRAAQAINRIIMVDMKHSLDRSVPRTGSRRVLNLRLPGASKLPVRVAGSCIPTSPARLVGGPFAGLYAPSRVAEVQFFAFSRVACYQNGPIKCLRLACELLI